MVEYISRVGIRVRDEQGGLAWSVRDLDWLLLGAVAALLGVGLWAISGITRHDVPGDPNYYLVRQGIFAVLGLVAFFVGLFVDPELYRKHKRWVYGLMTGGMVFVILVGAAARGSRRWIDLGFFRFQPSEFGKLLFILFFAAFLADRSKRLGQWRTTGATIGLAAVPILLVFAQPDIGTALVYSIALAAVLFVAGSRWTHLAALATVAAVGLLAVLWLLSVPRRRAAWKPFIIETALLACGFALLTTPIAWWYVQRPGDLLNRLDGLSVFHPRNAAINLKLYGTLDPAVLLVQQTVRSVQAFFMANDTSPNYHFEAPLLDPASALLLLPGLVFALRRNLKVTLALAGWIVLSLVAGAILLIEPPTSYHYIVTVPLVLIFAALCLEWIARARFGVVLAATVLIAISIGNLYMYFGLYPYKGAWYSLESDVGYYAHSLHNCSVWYVGSLDPTARKISNYIATPTAIQFAYSLEQLMPAIAPYLTDEQPDVIIVPHDKGEVMARLKQALPGGNEQVYVDRGRSMLRTYTLRGKSGHRINRFRFTMD